MDDFISMLLKTEIDIDKSVSIINEQIKKLSGKIDPVKVKIDIDEEKLKNIDRLNEKLNNIAGKSINHDNIKSNIQDFSALQGQIDSLIKEYSKFGTVTANLSFGKNKDDLKKFTIQLRDTQDNIQKFYYELNKSGEFELQNINVIDKTQENYNKSLNETVKIQNKLRKEQEKVYKSISEAQSKQLWEMSKERLDSIGRESDEIKKLNQYYKELEKTSSNIVFKQTI